jgi:hypothetical protein
MNLYAITSDNQTTFVQAGSIGEALMLWNTHMDLCNEEPDSITLAADEDQVVMASESDEIERLRSELDKRKADHETTNVRYRQILSHNMQLQDMRDDVLKKLEIEMPVPPEGGGITTLDITEKIMAELVTLKAMADGYATYVEGKAGTANHNAEKMARLAHRNAVLEREIKIANDKLDAKEGTKLP